MSAPQQLRGVVEGFYGPPYRHDQRVRLVRFLADVGMNTYLYAPKDDLGHRRAWRDGHLATEWQRLAELRQVGASVGVDVWFGLSPLHLDPTDEGDRERLIEVFKPALDHGFRHLCLLVDDMPSEEWTEGGEQELARVHAELVNEWSSRMRGHVDQEPLGLLFVPLHYEGDPTRPHVRELGRLVDPDVGICWTGPEVCSEHLSADHTAAISASLRRPVVYWDNHPVNDGAMRADPHLLPLMGREPGLAAHAGGLLANLAIEPEASLLAVSTVADFLADPDGYDRDSAWRSALERVVGDAQDAAAVDALARLTPRSPLHRGAPPPESITEAIEQVRAATPDELPAAAAAVYRLVDDLGVVVQQLGRLRNRPLVSDLRPWARALDAQRVCVQQSCAALKRAIHAHDNDVFSDQLAAVELGSVRAAPHRVADAVLIDLAWACLHAAERATDAS